MTSNDVELLVVFIPIGAMVLGPVLDKVCDVIDQLRAIRRP